MTNLRTKLSKFPNQLFLAASITILFSVAPNADAASKKISKEQEQSANSAEFVHFAQWKEVGEFIDQMVVKHGFDKAELVNNFDKTRYIESAIQLMKPAPSGRPKTGKLTAHVLWMRIGLMLASHSGTNMLML